MSELNKREGFSQYDSLPTEELQEILRKHANGELQTEPDTDELYYIMEVLARRREEEDPRAFRSDEEALADFRKNYMSKAKQESRTKVIQFPSRFLKTVAAVLVAVLILAVGTSVTAEAFQIDIWGKFANWTKEIFRFTDNPQDSTVANPEKENNMELKTLQDALIQNGITAEIVPTWLPGEYVFRDINVMCSPREKSISANFERNNEELIISIRQTISVEPEQIEKNDKLLEVYVVDDVEYYIFSNTETLQTAWVLGEFECQIIGRITIEEMKEMINSIT